MTFGHLPFGHHPFGHSVSIPQIMDLAFNPIANPSIGQMLGFVESDEDVSNESYNLDMYNFILQSIREEDKKYTLFLKRYLQGPQSVWETIQSKIFKLKNLWDITKVDEEWLPFLRPIVGWSSDLDYITDQLETDQLRRVIASSVALWKSRGNEDSLIDLLSLSTGARMRIWNWFDFRWVLDETITGEEHDGLDSWMIDLPIDGVEEYWSNLRIVDDGSLNKQLVKDIVGLMRASSERFQIVYLALLDLFEVDDDASQWYDTFEDSSTGAALSVENGEASFSTTAAKETAMVASELALGWDNYVAYWRVKPSVGADLHFYCSDLENSFTLRITPATPNGTVEIGETVLGVFSNLYTAQIAEGIEDEQYHAVRAAITSNTITGNISVVVYFNNVEILNEEITPTFVSGGIGFGHEINQTISISEVEVLRLPANNDIVNINTA